MISGIDGEPAPREAPALQTPTAEPTTPPLEQPEPNLVMIIIGIVLLVIAVVFVIIGLVRLARIVLAALRDRMRPLPDAADTEIETATAVSLDDAVDAPAVQRGIAAALFSMSEHGDPGDAIIAAWLGLEETASDVGSARGLAETPAEFTLRILLQRAGIGAPARRLLRLYEQVRFGGRQADETMRRDARSALAEIERGWR